MDDCIHVIIKDPQVQIKIKGILDKYIKQSNNYQSKIGYDTLTQNVFLEKLKNLMSNLKVDIDIKLKKKISRTKFLESRVLC